MPQFHRFEAVVGKYLIESHGKQFRAAGRQETLVGEFSKVPALGEIECIAESKGHAHRG